MSRFRAFYLSPAKSETVDGTEHSGETFFLSVEEIAHVSGHDVFVSVSVPPVRGERPLSLKTCGNRALKLPYCSFFVES